MAILKGQEIRTYFVSCEDWEFKCTFKYLLFKIIIIAQFYKMKADLHYLLFMPPMVCFVLILLPRIFRDLLKLYKLCFKTQVNFFEATNMQCHKYYINNNLYILKSKTREIPPNRKVRSCLGWGWGSFSQVFSKCRLSCARYRINRLPKNKYITSQHSDPIHPVLVWTASV